MDDTDHPTPDSSALPATGPDSPPDGARWIRATHQLRRLHDGSVISTHCSLTCGLQALEDLTLTAKIGPNYPGPLQEIRVDLYDLATGEPGAFTVGMTPLSGEPTDLYSWP